MIARMDHGQGADASPGRWASRSDGFLAAAECLPAEPTFHAPRGELLARAVEYRLKAYLHAVRGGAPPGDDLTHLLRLAIACGLGWNAEQDRVLAVLAEARLPVDPVPVPPEPAAVRALCRAVDDQMGGAL